MTKLSIRSFRKSLAREVFIMDGAMGTFLQSRGLPMGTPPDLWNLENPQAVLEAHREYVKAGAQIILTNTFGASVNRLDLFGIGKKHGEINKAAVYLAREACGDKAWVAGSIGPLGTTKKSFGELGLACASAQIAEQALLLAASGCNLIVLETMTNPDEIHAAVTSITTALSDMPLILSLTVTTAGLLPSGHDPLAIAHDYRDTIVAIGLNCSFGPALMFPVFERLKSGIKLPVLVKPNAGLPTMIPILDPSPLAGEGQGRGGMRGKLVYPLQAKEFAEWGKRFADAGANLIGGCCGTTPEFIDELTKQLKNISKKK